MVVVIRMFSCFLSGALTIDFTKSWDGDSLSMMSEYEDRRKGNILTRERLCVCMLSTRAVSFFYYTDPFGSPMHGYLLPLH